MRFVLKKDVRVAGSQSNRQCTTLDVTFAKQSFRRDNTLPHNVGRGKVLSLKAAQGHLN